MKEAAKQKILILSGDFGDGHKQAARALLEASAEYSSAVETVMIDFMEWTHPRLHTFSRYCYLQWVTRFPSMYGYLFQKTRDDNTLSQWFKKMRLFGVGRMLKLLAEVRPDVVVSTFPSAAAAMSLLKASGWTAVPTVTVITDHTDHSYWIHPYTDRYLVGSERVCRALQERGVPAGQIAVTGIPIRRPFLQSFNRTVLRLRHGLSPDLPVVLVMGGGTGIIGKEFAKLLSTGRLPAEFQFIIVCGRNDKLRLRLTSELYHYRHRVLITGYVDHVHELMALSDLIITKPGGLTITEAVASGLPMLLYKPLPGQERDNAAYLMDAGLALQAQNAEELLNLLINLFQNTQILTKIRERAQQLQGRSATLEALSAIIRTRGSYAPGYDIGVSAYDRGMTHMI